MNIHHFSSILVHKTAKLGQLSLQKCMLCKHSPYKGAHSFDIQPKNRTLHVCHLQTLHTMFACSSSDDTIVVGYFLIINQVMTIAKDSTKGISFTHVYHICFRIIIVMINHKIQNITSNVWDSSSKASYRQYPTLTKVVLKIS